MTGVEIESTEVGKTPSEAYAGMTGVEIEIKGSIC